VQETTYLGIPHGKDVLYLESTARGRRCGAQYLACVPQSCTGQGGLLDFLPNLPSIYTKIQGLHRADHQHEREALLQSIAEIPAKGLFHRQYGA
jgi:hypothetical protein